LNSFISNFVSKAIGSGNAGTSATGRTAAWVPLIESFYKDKNLVVRVWLPGCDPSKIDVQVSGNLLTIKGERTFPYEPEDDQLYSEVAYGPFERTVTLPDTIKHDALTAKYVNGVLEISMPVREEVLPKKVTVEIAKPSAEPALTSAR
jgi:HSP20 family protein